MKILRIMGVFVFLAGVITIGVGVLSSAPVWVLLAGVGLVVIGSLMIWPEDIIGFVAEGIFHSLLP